ncbi:monodehydroascorbate reductase [Tanacetum coccineum]
MDWLLSWGDKWESGMYAKCNNSNSTKVLFGEMSGRVDVVLWNSIISACSGCSQSVELLSLFRDMMIDGVVPNTYTFVAALQACEEPSYLVFGKELHAYLLKSDLYLDKCEFDGDLEVKGWLDEDLDNYHLKELRCSTQCHTQMSMWIISRGVVLLILLMLGISFKFDISGLLPHVITTIAYRIRDKDTSQSKQNLQSSSMTFIHKTLIIPSVLDSCFISSTVSEVKRVAFRYNVLDCVLLEILDCDTMADVNVNAPAEQAPAMAPPTRTDDQILPRSRWVPVGKSNCYLDVEKSQSNPIYKIAVDILKHTNFFRAFTASSTIPSIYIQQFWDTITQVDNNNPFSSPPTLDALINFIKELGYLKVVRTLSAVVTNDMFQPWRALTTIINLCLTGKTSAFERPRAPVLQILWGGKKKANPLVIPSVRFTKLIIYHLQSKHKFYPRPDSPLNLPYKEYVLGYLKFSAKGTKREVFGMPIPNDLITDDFRGEQYYNEYLEKVAKHQIYLAGEEVSDPDSPAPKPAKATKPKATNQSKPLATKAAPVTKPVAAEAPKPIASQPPKPTPATTEPSKKDQSKKRKLGKGKEKVSDEQVALDLLTLQTPKKKSPAEQYIFQRRSSAPTEPSGHDESSSLYAELGLTDSETESDEEVPGIDAGDQDEGQARLNPGIQDEGQAGSNPGDSAVSQPQSNHAVHAGLNRKHMDFEENLKFPTEDQVRLEEPASSAGTLSSLLNLDKELSFADQFLVEKSQEDEPKKTNTESEVQSMVTVHIHQDTSFVPLMTTPVIDLTVSQPVSTTVQAPLPTSTTTVTAITTTTSLPPPPPQPQQSTTYSILIKRIGELKQHMADLVNIAVDEIFTDAVDWAIQAPLRDRFRDLPEADMKEILHHRIWETKSNEAHEDHKKLYEALEKSMDRDHSDQLLTDLAEARRKKKRRHDSPQTPPRSPPHQPPPHPPPAGPSGTLGASGPSRSSQLPPPLPPPSTN